MDIIRAFEESYDEAGAGRSSETEFAPVLATAVDPLVQMCERSADSLHPDAPSRWLSYARLACIPVSLFVYRRVEEMPGRARGSLLYGDCPQAYLVVATSLRLLHPHSWVGSPKDMSHRRLRPFPVCARVDESNSLNPSTRHIYIINCLAPMQEALAGRPCAAGKARELAQAMEVHTTRLVGGECGRLLSQCGMAEVAERVRCAAPAAMQA